MLSLSSAWKCSYGLERDGRIDGDFWIFFTVVARLIEYYDPHNY